MKDIVKEIIKTEPVIYDDESAIVMAKLGMLEDEYNAEKHAASAYFASYRKASGHCKRLRGEIDDLRRFLKERGMADF